MKANTNYSIREAKKALEEIVTTYVAKSEDGSYLIPEIDRQPPYLVGPPGVGKTMIVQSVAKKKSIGYLSYSLVHHTRNSFLGLPMIVDEKDNVKSTEYTVSEIIKAVWDEYRNGYREGILFLDEFSCMSDTLTPVMLSFLQQRVLGRHKLPEGWMIVLAGNPPEYNRSARTFDMATTDRLRILNIEYDDESWFEYANENNVHAEVYGYLDMHRDQLFYLDREHKEETVTPRSWTNLSNNLKAYDKLGIDPDYRMIMQFIKCRKYASGFWQYMESVEYRMSREEMTCIYSGRRDDPQYMAVLKRCMEIEDNYARFRATELLSDFTMTRANEDIKKSGASSPECARCIENVFDFLSKLDEGNNFLFGSYVRALAGRIGRNSDVLKYIGSFDVPSYNRIMMSVFNVAVDELNGKTEVKDA